ncbi:MAG: hypothetical protein AB1324_08010 [Candidatus Micrarchaeota archaeon]
MSRADERRKRMQEKKGGSIAPPPSEKPKLPEVETEGPAPSIPAAPKVPAIEKPAAPAPVAPKPASVSAPKPAQATPAPKPVSPAPQAPAPRPQPVAPKPAQAASAPAPKAKAPPVPEEAEEVDEDTTGKLAPQQSKAPAPAPAEVEAPAGPQADPEVVEEAIQQGGPATDSGTATFDENKIGETYPIPGTGYKFVHQGPASQTSRKFSLVGKEDHNVDLELNELKEIVVPDPFSKKKESITLSFIYRGVNERGRVEVDWQREGGKSAAQRGAEAAKRVGKSASTFMTSLSLHWPEITFGAAGASIGVLSIVDHVQRAGAMGWVHTAVQLTLSAVAVGMAVAAGVSRKGDRARLEEAERAPAE